MPSLFRFLTVVAVLGEIVYGVVFALANFVNPKPREMSVTIPGQVPQEIGARCRFCRCSLPGRGGAAPGEGLRSIDDRLTTPIEVDQLDLKYHRQRERDGTLRVETSMHAFQNLRRETVGLADAFQDLRCQTDQPVPRHARGRTGRRRQYARRLSRRPRGFPGIPRRQRQGLRRRRNRGAARTTSPTSIHAASSRRAWRGGCRRCGICFVSCSTSEFAATIPPPSCPARSAAAACPRCCR